MFPSGNIEVEGKQNSLFHEGPVIKCFVIPPNSKMKKNKNKNKKLRRNRLLDAGWFTNVQRFQGARSDHVRVERSSFCFRRELVSFDPRRVTRISSIGKRI